VLQPTGRFLLKAAAATLLVSAAAAFPVAAVWGSDGLRALAVAAAVAFLGAAASRLPRLLIPVRGPETVVHRAMAGIGMRLLGTAVLTLIVVVTRLVPPIAFAACVVALYAVLLGIELREAVVEVGRAPVAPATPPAPAGGDR
jgi:hypothetical protein